MAILVRLLVLSFGLRPAAAAAADPMGLRAGKTFWALVRFRPEADCTEIGLQLDGPSQTLLAKWPSGRRAGRTSNLVRITVLVALQ